MSERRRCELCGREDHDIVERVVCWSDDVVAMAIVPRYERVLRCPNFQACRGRVESAGGSWRVVDAVTRPTVKPGPDRQEVQL